MSLPAVLELPERRLTVNWGVGELTQEAAAEESSQVCALVPT